MLPQFTEDLRPSVDRTATEHVQWQFGKLIQFAQDTTVQHSNMPLLKYFARAWGGRTTA